ncbi:hypothetical protein [Providencia manganoxydans]|uniref:hypothetical protein n=1 Tax=Providencia manganoxydans TaxID=2923283 RepID=UPI0034DDBC32
MCECFTEVGKGLENKIKGHLPEGANLKSAGWKQNSLFMGKDGVMRVGYFIEFNVKYQGVKKDGTPKARLSNYDHAVLFSFCPFCGEKQD